MAGICPEFAEDPKPRKGRIVDGAREEEGQIGTLTDIHKRKHRICHIDSATPTVPPRVLRILLIIPPFISSSLDSLLYSIDDWGSYPSIQDVYVLPSLTLTNLTVKTVHVYSALLQFINSAETYSSPADIEGISHEN